MTQKKIQKQQQNPVKWKQYQMCELEFAGKELESDWAQISMEAELACRETRLKVQGFYAGGGSYKVRFLPEVSGVWSYQISGCIQAAGEIEVFAADGGRGMVKAEGFGFRFQDGTQYQPFGTTVYALMHQEEELVTQTMESLKQSPFNKVRFCVFPKHYLYNHNEPGLYAFEKRKDESWDVSCPCFAFWDRLDELILQLEDMQVQADLILFHPYDRWGFSSLSQDENLVYLDYLLRRLSAMPNVWWSLANEYDFCLTKSLAQWEEIECFTAEHDPHHHLMSNHNMFVFWDFTRPNITHVSIQTKMLTRISEWRKAYKKPVVVDECCYEGNLPQFWGSISGREMTNRFWRVFVTGGYCTHGETFLDKEREILWWAKGGTLKGESPKRIAFLREIAESLPGPVEPEDSHYAQLLDISEQERERRLADMEPKYADFMRAAMNLKEELRTFAASEFEYRGHCGKEAYLIFYDLRTCASGTLDLPQENCYCVELIDTWEMTRTVLLERVSGTVEFALPGKEGMAVLASKVLVPES